MLLALLVLLGSSGLREPRLSAAWAQPQVDIETGSRDGRWAEIQLTGQLRVGIDPALGRAYLYTNPDSRSYEGFEWDILQALAETLEISLDPVYVPWDLQLEALQAGEIDLAFGAREPDGLDQADFLATDPYYFSPQRLVIPANLDNPPERLSQLFGLRVGIVVNSTGAALLETYNRSRGNAIRLFGSSNPERLFDQLQGGQLEAVVIDQPVAVVAVAEAQQPLLLVGPPLLARPLVGVVNRNHLSVKQAIDQGILSLRQGGKLRQILEDWQLWDSTATFPALSED
ncbi:MAG: transporter substrate-binding domain-containing protein [Synechococcaceae cyanobacterium SM2_3_2]|nr:transporter substrate-binding domain-containing protein [Synechococcaceae cyanobacterium SM2_3_2]